MFKDKDKKSSKQSEWYDENKIRIRKKQKQYYLDNKEAFKKRCNKWRENNKKAFSENRKAYRKKFRDLCNNIKLINGCAVCKEKEVSCLDFHHIKKEDKKDDISKLVSKGMNTKLMKEIKKCMILCANCHRKFGANKITLPSEYTIKI